MMQPVIRIDGTHGDSVAGRPVLDLPKTLWNGSMLAGVLLLAIPNFTWAAFAMFLGLTYVTLLIGHSVGMHRMMIHRSFGCRKWLERPLIYIGTLVGVAGPFGIIRIHDMRDWAQRQSACHDFFSHTRGYWRDIAWQLGYRFEFEQPPAVTIEPNLASDPFYRFLEATWRWHQLPLAAILFAIGGWGWVGWGICARVFTSAAGHWTITYFCHRPDGTADSGKWDVRDASVQAANLKGLGLLTYGECWHNNHHAFPESAQIGLDKGQSDPAWWLIAAMDRLDWLTYVNAPRSKDEREDLSPRQ